MTSNEQFKEQFRAKLRDQREILIRCIKENRDMYTGEKRRYNILENEIVDLEKQIELQSEPQKPKNIIQMEEVPLSAVDKNIIGEVNNMITFCQQDLGLTGVQARYYREYWDGNPRRYSGLAFSQDGPSRGFCYPGKYDNTIWINSEIRGYGENVQIVAAHEMKHLQQGYRHIDEEDAATYGRLATLALHNHYSSVKECCDRNNIAYYCGFN